MMLSLKSGVIRIPEAPEETLPAVTGYDWVTNDVTVALLIGLAVLFVAAIALIVVALKKKKLMDEKESKREEER